MWKCRGGEVFANSADTHATESAFAVDTNAKMFSQNGGHGSVDIKSPAVRGVSMRLVRPCV